MMALGGAPNVVWIELVGGARAGRKVPVALVPIPQGHSLRFDDPLEVYLYDPLQELFICRYSEGAETPIAD